MRTRVLLASMGLAAAAACAPAAPPPPVTPGAPGDPAAVAGVRDPSAPATPVASAPPGVDAPPPAPAAMRAPVATALGAELGALGLDPAKLPPLAQLEGDKLRKVMKLFTRSLGVRCGDCHTDDFAAPTPRKAVASRMWDEFVRGYTKADGAPLFCDSCHQGKLVFLDRRDDRALGAWMKEQYVAGLRGAAGAPHDCKSCHGDPFVGEFLDLWKRPGEKRPVGKAPTQR